MAIGTPRSELIQHLRTPFPRRALAGLCFQRVGQTRSLRCAVPRRTRQVAGFRERWKCAAVEPRWQGTLLCEPELWCCRGSGQGSERCTAIWRGPAVDDDGVSSGVLLRCYSRRQEDSSASSNAASEPVNDGGDKLDSKLEEVVPTANASAETFCAPSECWRWA